jgi:glutamate/tyrosine decarboxylase-like PLP-dependent enzyme
VALPGPRYFGFVVGGSLPAAVAADWLVSAWDQNTAVYALSPLGSVIEQITGSWLRELAGLPSAMSFGFTTGCQMANFTALAAARHRVLREAGWDVEADGVFGAPPINVVVSEESHYTIFLALRLLGLGANRLRPIPTDDQGRMRAEALAAALAELRGPTIVCAQAGNVNTGAFDPLPEISQQARASGAWLHVDGAFGLWAAASPERATLVRGIENADSIATDAHKWLNAPTTAESSSALMKPRTAAPCRLPRPTLSPAEASEILTSSCRKNRAARARFRSMPPCARWDARASPN